MLAVLQSEKPQNRSFPAQPNSMCHSNISGKLQNLAPKFGATGRELIFEEENFSGNLQDLIENLHTLNMLASNITQIDEPNLKKVNVTDADKGRSLEEDFVFNDVALESVENLVDYKDELDPIYGLDDPNNIIGIDDVIASVTIRVDDNEEGKSTKVDKTAKEMNAEAEATAGDDLLRKNDDDVIASVTIRVDGYAEGKSKENNKDPTKVEMNAEAEATAGDGLLKKNETEKKSKWVWRRRRESGETKTKANRLVGNHISHTIVRDSELSKREIDGEDSETREGVEAKRKGGEGRVRRGEVKVQREQEGRTRARTMGDMGGMERAGDKRTQRQFQEGREIVERGIQHREHGPKRRSEEAQREIQRQEDVLGKTRERVRRQVLDAVLVPCKTGQLCIISGQFMKCYIQSIYWCCKTS